MKLSATIPVALNGRPRDGDRIRRFNVWLETEFEIPSVTKGDAPLVARWDAAYDDRLVHLASREDWGPWPEDGQQSVRQYDGSYWRPAILRDAEGLSATPSPVLDIARFEESLDRKSLNRIAGIDVTAAPGRRARVIREPQDVVDIVAFDEVYTSRYREPLMRLDRMRERCLVIGGVVHLRCAEPMVVLSDCAIMDRRENVLRMLRIDTNAMELKERMERLPLTVFPLGDFDAALWAAAEGGYDPAANLAFNERRRPEILRPDLLPDRDLGGFRAILEARRLVDHLFTQDEMAFANEASRCFHLLKSIVGDHERGMIGYHAAVSAIEDLMPLMAACWDGQWEENYVRMIERHLDSMSIAVRADNGGNRP